jgi:hypothetical protein
MRCRAGCNTRFDTRASACFDCSGDDAHCCLSQAQNHGCNTAQGENGRMQSKEADTYDARGSMQNHDIFVL